MNKTDFAELKERLCYFDSQKNYNEILTETLIKNATRDSKDLFVVMYSGARNAGRNEQNTKSAAIISELIEIIKSQSEALESINNDFGFFHHANKRYIESGKDKQDVTKVGTPIRIATEKLETCVSETTTRLQKLRDGK